MLSHPKGANEKELTHIVRGRDVLLTNRDKHKWYWYPLVTIPESAVRAGLL